MSTSLCAGNEVTPELITIPEGSFVFGSSQSEREYAYRLDEQAYGHSVTRQSGWYDSEPPLQTINLGGFQITENLVTNQQYQRFIVATGHPPPDIDEETWQSYRLVHPFSRTQPHRWTGDQYPPGRALHPVVLVSHHDATAYARWLSDNTDSRWRLPTEREWVKAARGSNGNIFPWGNRYNEDKLNSHDAGPFDTVAVGSRSAPSPFGLMDAAGQVFEWINSPPEAARSWVKGGSWDDKGCGVCRPAARHSRPKALKHILIGFRLVIQ
ncbi:MAG: SUMF1/EgtB/PvdO family nonheme iron enzyme [Pseudomonadota bacterium]